MFKLKNFLDVDTGDGFSEEDVDRDDRVSERGGPEDFSTDVLSSARKSLIRGTPKSEIHHKGPMKQNLFTVKDSGSEGNRSISLTELQFSSEED